MLRNMHEAGKPTTKVYGFAALLTLHLSTSHCASNARLTPPPPCHLLLHPKRHHRLPKTLHPPHSSMLSARHVLSSRQQDPPLKLTSLPPSPKLCCSARHSLNYTYLSLSSPTPTISPHDPVSSAAPALLTAMVSSGVAPRIFQGHLEGRPLRSIPPALCCMWLLILALPMGECSTTTIVYAATFTIAVATAAAAASATAPIATAGGVSAVATTPILVGFSV